MLNFSLSGNILEVEEVQHSFTDTQVSYLYIDISTWQQSVLGKKNEVPSQPMSEGAISWARRWYLPKVGIPHPDSPLANPPANHHQIEDDEAEESYAPSM